MAKQSAGSWVMVKIDDLAAGDSIQVWGDYPVPIVRIERVKNERIPDHVATIWFGAASNGRWNGIGMSALRVDWFTKWVPQGSGGAHGNAD